MDKKTKVDFVINALENLYPNPKAPLFHKDPYTLLIAVLLSAQCTDERVNKITPILFQKADSAEKMINLTVHEIEEIIRPCGLAPMKSKGIYGLSRMIVEHHNGNVPRTFKELESFPSVGHKTASVVISQAYNIPAFPVDTHIHRLMFRWGFSKGISVKKTELDAKRLFPKKLWNKLHLQIIFYGRDYSPARGWDIEKDFITKKIGRRSLFK